MFINGCVNSSQEDWQPWCRDQTSLHHLLIRSLAIVSLICCRPGLRGFIFHLIFPLNFPYFLFDIPSNQPCSLLLLPFTVWPLHCLFNLLTSQPQTQWNHNSFSIRSWTPFWPFCIYAIQLISLFSCKNSYNVLAENSNRHCALNQHIFKNIVLYLSICALVLYLEAC